MVWYHSTWSTCKMDCDWSVIKSRDFLVSITLVIIHWLSNIIPYTVNSISCLLYTFNKIVSKVEFVLFYLSTIYDNARNVILIWPGPINHPTTRSDYHPNVARLCPSHSSRCIWTWRHSLFANLYFSFPRKICNG